jgi:CRISPR-associated exonuclease Cas4
MLDNEFFYFTITDLKQYSYCPRIFYYHSCLPHVRPITYKMERGIAVHQDEPQRAKRRSLSHIDGEVTAQYFEMAIQSPTLKLSGKIDEVLETERGWIPIDYKLANKAGFHFKVQLAAYALLLEEAKGTPVKYGYLYLIPRRKTEEVPITPKLKATVRKSLEVMEDIARFETMPPPTEWRQRCVDCEFKRFCNDV